MSSSPGTPPRPRNAASSAASRMGTAFRRASSFTGVRPILSSRKSSNSSLKPERTPSALAIPHPVVSSPSPVVESPAVGPDGSATEGPSEAAPTTGAPSAEVEQEAPAPAKEEPAPSMDAPIEAPALVYVAEPEQMEIMPPSMDAPIDSPVQPEPALIPTEPNTPIPEQAPVEIPAPVVAVSSVEERPALANWGPPSLPVEVPPPVIVASADDGSTMTTPAHLLQGNVRTDQVLLSSSETTPRPTADAPLGFDFPPRDPTTAALPPNDIPPPPTTGSGMPVPMVSAIPRAVLADARDPSVAGSTGSTEDYGYVLNNESVVSVSDPMQNPFADPVGTVRAAPEQPWMANPSPWFPGAMPAESYVPVEDRTPAMPVPASTGRRDPIHSDTLNFPYDSSTNMSTSANPSYSYPFPATSEGGDGERRPLLSRPATPEDRSKGKGKSKSRNTQGQVPTSTLQTLGWTPHILPDTTFYFHHVTLRVVTDLDLRSTRKLEALTHFLERKTASALADRDRDRDGGALVPEGWELWLKDSGNLKSEFRPVRNWVNHGARIVSFEPPPTRSAEASLPDVVSNDDRLDMEYRYWTFLETHPAHYAVPDTVVLEAMDALTWSYTDNVLPMPRHSSPFTHAECQELMRILQTLETRETVTVNDTTPFNAIVRTRVVAKILMRVAQWRQEVFRPEKSLPAPLSTVPERRIPFLRTVFSLVLSFLCLGIPYLFFERRSRGRFDEESGLMSNGSVFALAGSGCIVAAVILSASVTFLSLPGADEFARLSGIIAILLSSSSMVSAVLALFRHKADVDRVIAQPRGEGVLSISRRSVMLSLPLVFLAWATAALVAGVTLYVFRGSATNPLPSHPFEPVTQWAIVGVLGGLVVFLLLTSCFAS